MVSFGRLVLGSVLVLGPVFNTVRAHAGTPEHTCVIDVSVMGKDLGQEAGAASDQAMLSLAIRLPKENRCLFGDEPKKMVITLHTSQSTARKIKVGTRLRLSYDRVEMLGTESMHHEDAWSLIRLIK